MAYDVEILKGGNVLIRAGGDMAAEEVGNAFHRFLAERAAASAAAPKKELKIGDADPAMDGWVYAGLSPDDGKPFWAAPQDAPELMNWREAKSCARSMQDEFNAAGKPSRVWVPTKRELDQLYRHKDKGALKGTFNERGAWPAGDYWSSSEYYSSHAWRQRFSAGGQHTINKVYTSAVRCARRLDI